MGQNSLEIYDLLDQIQIEFDKIRNVPTEKKIEYEKLKKKRLEWKQQAEKIERDFNAASAKTAGAGAVGASFGTAVAAMGPTVAMGIATSFGVASTGTAISSLSGAAATNAALAWLGGGALSAGGGGMAAGSAFLAFFGPIGWAIAGLSVLAGCYFVARSLREKRKLEDIFCIVCQRDNNSFTSAIAELDERINSIKKESKLLKDAIENIAAFGYDYEKMSEEQQYMLGTYVNLMLSSTQLLTDRIKGLQDKIEKEDFESYVLSDETKYEKVWMHKNEKVIIYLANFFYKIDLDVKEKKLVWKCFKRNKDFLKSFELRTKLVI